MSRFNRKNFEKIITEIETAEKLGDNFWLSVGILEFMFDDDCGYIDEYFETKEEDRDVNALWSKLQAHIDLIEGDDLK